MESYKDVMLSEPPSRFNAAPSVQPVNLETYKGILLCDRPQAAAARNDAPIPFLPSGKAEDRFVGIQPSTEQRARLQMIRNTNMAKNQTGNAIVTKHKRWLKSFANTVKQAKMDHMESALVADARAAAFRDKQAALRRQAMASAPLATSGYDQPPPSSKKVKDEKAKPKWAMTETEADIAEDEELLTQHDDLLRFAQELDYDRFINDLEVQEAMAIMKERVEEIIAETGGDYRQGEGTRRLPPLSTGRAQEPAAHAYGPGMFNDKGWNGSTRLGGDMSSAINSEAMALADRILEGSESLRQIHTRQTLAKLLRDAVDSKKSQVTEIAPGGAVQMPTIVRVGAESTGHEAAPAQRRVLTDMRKATDKAQNLPYLYRCPAL